jgi:NAD(P)-dependent dehydrogenase (short-subunit alcohol dehydrogenase family)
MVFTKEGYRIVLNVRDENELSEAMNDIKKTVGESEERVTYFAGDIADEKTCSSLLEHTIKMFGRIDVLVNNAGILEMPRKAYKNSHLVRGIMLQMSTSREHSSVREKQ